MTTTKFRTRFRSRTAQTLVVFLCVLSLAPGETALYAQEAQQEEPPPEQEAPKIPNDQLDALVALATFPTRTELTKTTSASGD
jgi:hypothetical protein